MNIYEYINGTENEKPLDRIVTDGGFCGIFRTIGCIGDSLSSGEFESCKADGTKVYHDFYEYSWGQFIGRSCGSKVYNFSRGGMTAKEYVENFADKMGFGIEISFAKRISLRWGQTIFRTAEKSARRRTYVWRIIPKTPLRLQDIMRKSFKRSKFYSLGRRFFW